MSSYDQPERTYYQAEFVSLVILFNSWTAVILICDCIVIMSVMATNIMLFYVLIIISLRPFPEMPT